MSKIASMDFMSGFHAMLTPDVYDYVQDLLRWTRGQAVEILSLKKQLDALRAKLMTQEELQKVKVLEREKMEWEEEKKRLAGDAILERNIASKAVAEVKALQEQQVKDRASLSNKARKNL
ncbi:unnamed protein product [Calypogeia fissa]